MKRTLGLFFTFLLVFQSFTFGLGINGETRSQGAERSVVTDITIEQNKEKADQSNILISWSMKGLEAVSGYSESFDLPDDVSISEDQSGMLISEEDEVGTFTASTDGTVEIVFNEEIENNPESEGVFSIKAVVDLMEEDEEALEEQEDKKHEEDEEAEKETSQTESLEEEQDSIDSEAKESEEQNNTEYLESQQVFSSNEGTVIEENIITDVELSVLDENGEFTTLEPGEEITVDNPYDEFKVELNYNFALPDGHDYKDGSTYTIEIPEVFNVLANPESTPLRNEAGEEFGSFVVTNNNEIVITFNNEIEENSNVSGYINLESEFDAHYKGAAETEISFPIEGESNITYPIKFIPSSSSIDKKGVPDKSYNTETVTWTVDFNKDLQEINNATLVDVVEGEHSFVDGTLDVYMLYMNADGTIDESKTELIENHNFGESFPLNLGDIDSAYRIVYDTEINDNTGDLYSNEATLNGDNVGSVSASSSVDVNRGQPLEKSSTDYDNVTQTIEWEVKYNYDEKDIAEDEAKLTDVFGENQQFVNDSLVVLQVDIDPDTGEEVGTNDVNSEDYTVEETDSGFDFQFNKSINQAYKIVYETTAIERIDGNETITNTISDEFENEYESSRDIQQGILIKSHIGNTDYKAKETDWRVLINRDEHVMENVTFTDILPEGFTPKDVVVTHGGETIYDYTYSFNENERKIEIDFNQDITKEVMITYTTEIDFDQVNPNDVTYTNQATLQWIPENGSDVIVKEGSATFDPDQYTKNNGFKGASYNPVTKEITWTIGVNYNQTTVEEAIVEDFILGKQNFDIENVKVYEMELTGDANGYDKGDEVTTANITEVTNSDDEPGFRVELGDITSPYVIEYTTDLNDLLVEGSYDNKATLLDDNEVVNELEASVQPVHGGEYTNKNASQNNENPRIVNWNVNINFTQSTVTDLQIEDTPSINQALLEDTINLYGTTVTEAGINKDSDDLLEEGEDYTLNVTENDDGQQTFTIDFTEETIDRAYVLEYDTYILYEDDGNISNDAKFLADETENVETDDSYSSQIDLSNIGGGIDGEVGSLEITKVDYGDRSQTLEGAVFELYDSSGQTLLSTGTTDEDGIVTFNNLLYDDYILKETTAPEGYVVGISDEQTVTVDEDVTELEVTNKEIIHQVELTKIDEEINASLEGAVFELYQVGESSSIGTYTTDENGRIIVEQLEPGDYQFIETESPDGYLLDEEPISFTIGEQATETVEVTAYNTAIETKTISGEKIWKDGDSEDRPEMIKVDLLQDGDVYKTVEVSEQTDWTYSFTDLPKTDDLLNEYDYQVEEQSVDGYQSIVDGYDITNLRVGTTSVEGNKVWLDDNSPDRPESITVNLLQNGEVINSMEVSEEDNWDYRFAGLDQYDENGIAYEYTVQEEPVEGYETTIDGFNITNLRVGTTDVLGTKTWKDDNSSERPESIMVNLLQNGDEIDSQMVSEESNWEYQFAGLEKFDDRGVLYEYTISEEPIEGYESSIHGHDLTNVRVGYTDISGVKTWQDDNPEDRPEYIKVNLSQNGTVVDTAKVTAEENWEYSFTNVDKYNEEGVLYEYTVSEQDVPGYESEVDGFDITNTRSEQRSIEVTKSWLDGESDSRPDSITVTLLRNGELFETVDLTSANDWKYTFEDLEAYDENGKAYQFTVEENSVEGYDTSIEGFDITNLRVGEVDVSGTKTWKDDNSEDRPKSIKVDLLQNGTVIDTATVTADDQWTYSFTELDQYDDEGLPYKYTVEEQDVAGYVSEITGYDITNTRSGLKSIEVNKVWKEDEAAHRPEFITINLLRDGEIIKTVDVSADDQWSYVFMDLEKYNKNGKEHTYSVEEVAVEGYDVTIDETEKGFKITNTKIAELVESESDESIFPRTGDRSSTLPITIGAILIALAGTIVILSNRRKQSNE
ncbi:Cna B-type domain-containing protein [Alkalibacillus silvisoli]|uniref:Cna B-type domain-containing protein n=1 Tax=Alkalibacillus silvisoli TaxID=392823 RepID=A0ABN0ZYA2_9BACI